MSYTLYFKRKQIRTLSISTWYQYLSAKTNPYRSTLKRCHIVAELNHCKLLFVLKSIIVNQNVCCHHVRRTKKVMVCIYKKKTWQIRLKTAVVYLWHLSPDNSEKSSLTRQTACRSFYIRWFHTIKWTNKIFNVALIAFEMLGHCI